MHYFEIKQTYQVEMADNYKVNNTISLAWFLYFFLCLPIIFLSRDVSPLFRLGQGVLALGAVGITEYYPKWYMKK